MTGTSPIAWLSGVGALGGAAISAIWGPAVQPEVWWGLFGPLVSAAVSWLLMARAAAQGPEQLTALMMKALVAKMVLFGAYVSAVLLAWDTRPVPFVASFTGFFIVFHAMEALFLKRRLLDTVEPAPEHAQGRPN